MEVQEFRKLIRKTLKNAIIDANNQGRWKRVEFLKFKRAQLRKKLAEHMRLIINN